MKGLTLIEILISILILVILALLIPLGIDFYKRQELENQARAVLQTLRRAQLKAMAIEFDSSFGVHLTDERYVLFKGNSYETRDPQYDEVFNFPEIISVSGLSEIVFSKLEGRPSVTGEIILNIGEEKRVIIIDESGLASFPPVFPYLAQLHYRWRNDDGSE